MINNNNKFQESQDRSRHTTFNILIAVYNGERYLKEMLESLVNQQNETFVITIRDDLSQDHTGQIIRQYAARYPHLIRIVPSGDHHLGYPDCFWYLLSEAETADYYCYCDQDDVWSLQKLKRAASLLKKEPAGIPLLYIHDYFICDSGLKIIEKSHIPDFDHLNGRQLIFYAYVQGFAMIINDTLRRLLLRENPLYHELPHDMWTLWNAFYCGKILHDPHTLAKYRRHVQAYTPTGGNALHMADALLRKEIIGDTFSSICAAADYFSDACSNIMPCKDQFEWKLLSFRKDRTVKRYLQRLFFPCSLRPNAVSEAALRLLFLLGK